MSFPVPVLASSSVTTEIPASIKELYKLSNESVSNSNPFNASANLSKVI